MTKHLLSKIPVLDKGHVALYSTSLPRDEFKTVSAELFRNQVDPRLLDMTTIILHIKCPLFVQLTFSEHNLSCVSYKLPGKPDAFIPTIAEVNAESLEASTAIQKDIEQTTEALIINPTAYQSENCDLFVSQVISPVNIYNTLLVHGSLTSWLRYIDQRSFPKPIEAYRRAIEECLAGEWDQTIRGGDNDSKKVKRQRG